MSYDLSWPSWGLFSHSLGSGWEKQEESLRDRDFRASRNYCWFLLQTPKALFTHCDQEVCSSCWPQGDASIDLLDSHQVHTHPLLIFSSFFRVSTITYIVRLKNRRIHWLCPDFFLERYLISPQSMLHTPLILEVCQECNFQVFPGYCLRTHTVTRSSRNDRPYQMRAHVQKLQRTSHKIHVVC